MKKFVAVILAATLLAVSAAPVFASDTLVISSNVSDDEPQLIGMANPFTDHEKLSEAEVESGVTLTLPETIVGYRIDDYRAASSLSLIEVIYNKKVGGQEIRIRKAVGDEDISGDYNNYAETTSKAINSNAVTMKGTNGKIYLATWTSGESTYSVSSEEGLSAAAMSNLVHDIK